MGVWGRGLCHCAAAQLTGLFPNSCVDRALLPYLRREEHSTQPIARALPIAPLLLLLRLAPPPQLAMVVSGCEAFSLTLDEHAALVQGVGTSGLGLGLLVRVSIIVAQASA